MKFFQDPDGYLGWGEQEGIYHVNHTIAALYVSYNNGSSINSDNVVGYAD